jgi:hypothetical protein
VRAAPATVLYALVTRVLQCSLTKAAPHSAVAERASTTRINCGGWASLPTEASRLRHRVRDTWRLRTPPERSAEPRLTGPGWYTWRSGTHPRGPDPHLQALSTFVCGTRGVTGPVPERGAGPGRWPDETESDPRGLAAQLLGA